MSSKEDETEESSVASLPPIAQAVVVEIDASPVTVQVISPADLGEGYQFDVEVGGHAMRVAVPSGEGVSAGESFQAIVLPERSSNTSEAKRNNPHDIPTGHWRRGFCHCWCRRCDAQCCLAIWCTPCAIAQVMTRMNLGYCAEPLNGKIQTMSTFRFVLILAAICQIALFLLGSICNVNSEDTKRYQLSGNEEMYLVFLEVFRDALVVASNVYFLIIFVRTRKFVRNKYEISTKCCGRCEDFCTSLFCSCCAVTQMASHTANYDVYPPSCCTDMGYEAPHVV